MPVVQVYFYAAVICIVTILMRRFRRAEFSIFEPGVTFGAFALLYSIVPLLAFSLVDDISTHPQADVRLNYETASLEAVSAIGWLHLWFFTCFTLTYLGFRIEGRPLRVKGFRADDLDLAIGAAMLAGCKIIIWLGLRYYSVSAGNYLETYTQLDTLPLLARQVLTHLAGLIITCSVLLCVGLMSRREYRWILPIWLGLEAVLLAGSQGSRTTVFAICLATLASYHYLARRISASLILTLLGMAFLAFASVGAYRDIGPQVNSVQDFLVAMLIRNEFTSIFINALDIQQLRDAGMTDSVVPQVYFADLVNIVPQQFLPIEKLDLSSWYVQRFYPEYAALGGGFVFGIISEAVVGFGYLDAGVRAVLLGVLLAAAHAWVTSRKQPSLWMITFYIWLLVLSFRLFRGTTLALMPVFILDFLPAYVLFRAVRAVTLGYVGVMRKRSAADSSPS